ncbi:hypothetical protein [Kitasatospora sp. NE20-6]|uniref:hypothetical protein n=1 Tax=Kitasatospora sp. NE20-6 TaxID=2859066 RepID=UPI0038B2B6C3
MNDEGSTPGAGTVRERTSGHVFDPEVLWNAYSSIDPYLAPSLGPSSDLGLGRWFRSGDRRP